MINRVAEVHRVESEAFERRRKMIQRLVEVASESKRGDGVG